MKKLIELLKRIVFKYYFKHTFSFDNVSVFKLKHKTKLPAFFMFGLLSNKGIDEMCMSWEQILYFCKKFPDQISKDDSSALLSDGMDYYIANIYKSGDGFHLSVNEFGKSWDFKEPEKRIIIMNP
jgi:hypothetical protein